MLIKQMDQKNIIIVIFQIKVLILNYIFAMVVMSDLMQKAMNFNDVAIVSFKGNDYRIYFWYMNKDDSINIMKNSNLNEKSRLL